MQASPLETTPSTQTFVATMPLVKKDYLRCNMYYLLRYFGWWQLLLFVLYVGASIAIFCIYYNALLLVFAGIVLVLLGVAVLIAYLTTLSGYKIEFEARGLKYQKLYFSSEKLAVDSFREGHELLQQEEFLVTRIEKIAIKKDVVYVYPMSAICYYIREADLEGATLEEFKDFLRGTFPETTFKMHKKVKNYPTNVLN